MIELLLGTIIAVAALAFVLAPLFRESPATREAAGTRAAQDSSAGDRAVEVLREIEFDRQTGKLSEPDYAELRATYTQQAVEAMRRGTAVGDVRADAPADAAAGSDAEIEARILEYRRRTPGCPTCGPRPEADAVYCSECGRYLAGACSRCGAVVNEPGARYCGECGSGLAA